MTLDDFVDDFLSTLQDSLEFLIHSRYFHQNKEVRISKLVQMKRYSKCLTSNICRFLKLQVSDVIDDSRFLGKSCPSLIIETQKHSVV